MSSRSGIRRLALQALTAAAYAVVCALPAHASTSLFTNTGTVCTTTSICRAAGDFGALVGIRNASDQWVTNTVNYATGGGSSPGADVNGEIGVGSGSKLVFNSGNQNRTWDGPVDFADALATTSGYCGPSGTTACSVPTGNTLSRSGGSYNTRVNGGTYSLPAHVESAMEQMRDISAYWSGQSGTAVSSSSGVSNFGRSVTSFSGTGIQVRSVSGTINTTGNITISGDSTTLFIFNILSNTTSGSTAAIRLNNNITLSGISPDQVFFNILGTSAGTTHVLQATSTSSNMSGIVYVAADSYTINTTITSGRLMGGTGTSVWGANFVLNAPPDATPEPSTYILMVTGLGAFLYARKRLGKGNGR